MLGVQLYHQQGCAPTRLGVALALVPGCRHENRPLVRFLKQWHGILLATRNDPEKVVFMVAKKGACCKSFEDYGL